MANLEVHGGISNAWEEYAGGAEPAGFEKIVPRNPRTPRSRYDQKTYNNRPFAGAMSYMLSPIESSRQVGFRGMLANANHQTKENTNVAIRYPMTIGRPCIPVSFLRALFDDGMDEGNPNSHVEVASFNLMIQNYAKQVRRTLTVQPLKLGEPKVVSSVTGPEDYFDIIVPLEGGSVPVLQRQTRRLMSRLSNLDTREAEAMQPFITAGMTPSAEGAAFYSDRLKEKEIGGTVLRLDKPISFPIPLHFEGRAF
jgi:hypothetical protein